MEKRDYDHLQFLLGKRVLYDFNPKEGVLYISASNAVITYLKNSIGNLPDDGADVEMPNPVSRGVVIFPKVKAIKRKIELRKGLLRKLSDFDPSCTPQNLGLLNSRFP